MFSKIFCPAHKDSHSAKSRIIDVGWCLDTENAGFIWAEPRRLIRDKIDNPPAKSLTQCPALRDHEGRLYEVTCPFDVTLGFRWDDQKRPCLVNLDGAQSSIRPRYLDQIMTIIRREEWPNPNRPIVQLATPYVFVADEPVWMTQTPPFNHYPQTPLPGIVIGGRLPIDIWPRQMTWAFEWYDTSKPIVLKRGQPWFYVNFETQDPSRPIRLIEAEKTPALTEHIKGLTGVTNYVNQTYKLFETARKRRPKKLLTPVKR